MRNLIKDNRLIPTAVVFTFGCVALPVILFLAVWLNLADQAKGFIFFNEALKESVEIPMLGVRSHAWSLSLLVDTGMVVLEGFATFAAITLEYIRRDMSVRLKGVSHDDWRRLELESREKAWVDGRKWFTGMFILAAGLSVVMVGTAYVINVQGDGFAYGMRVSFSLLTGLVTPTFIFGSMYCLLLAVKLTLSLVTDETVTMSPKSGEQPSGRETSQVTDQRQMQGGGRSQQASQRQHGGPPPVVAAKGR